MKLWNPNIIKILIAYKNADNFDYYIKTNDFFKVCRNMIEYFDISDYPQPNKYNISEKKTGKVKDEYKEISEFLVSKPKCMQYKI